MRRLGASQNQINRASQAALGIPPCCADDLHPLDQLHQQAQRGGQRATAAEQQMAIHQNLRQIALGNAAAPAPARVVQIGKIPAPNACAIAQPLLLLSASSSGGRPPAAGAGVAAQNFALQVALTVISDNTAASGSVGSAAWAAGSRAASKGANGRAEGVGEWRMADISAGGGRSGQHIRPDHRLGVAHKTQRSGPTARSRHKARGFVSGAYDSFTACSRVSWNTTLGQRSGEVQIDAVGRQVGQAAGGVDGDVVDQGFSKSLSMRASSQLTQRAV